MKTPKTFRVLVPGAILALFSLSCSGPGGGGNGPPSRGGDAGPSGSGDGGPSGGGSAGSMAAAAPFESLITDYIQGWKDFYPDRAAGMGLHEYRSQAPDRSPERIRAWVASVRSSSATTSLLYMT